MNTMSFRIHYNNGNTYHGLCSDNILIDNEYFRKRALDKDFLTLNKDGKKIKSSECSNVNGLATITSTTKDLKLKITNVFISNCTREDALNKLLELLDKENNMKHDTPILTFKL